LDFLANLPVYRRALGLSPWTVSVRCSTVRKLVAEAPAGNLGADEAAEIVGAPNLQEFAQAMEAGEGTIQLERAPRHREAPRAELYRQFEQAAFPVSQETEP
jgi:hypothetical protein